MISAARLYLEQGEQSMNEQKESYKETDPVNAELIGMRGGDKEATRAFLLRYRALVLNTAAAELEDPEQAMQAARETLHDAVLRLRQGEQVNDICTWLITLTRSHAGTNSRTHSESCINTESCRTKSGGRKGDGLRTFCVCLLILLSILLIWILLGLSVRNFGWGCPDLGYRWFNSHIFDMF